MRVTSLGWIAFGAFLTASPLSAQPPAQSGENDAALDQAAEATPDAAAPGQTAEQAAVSQGEGGEAQARGIVDQIGQKAIAIFSKAGDRAGKLGEFRSLFQTYFNIPAIARHVLRQYWKKATDEEKKEYVKLFEDDIVHTYFNLLEKYYKNETFKVTKAEASRGNPKAVAVLSEIQRPNGQTVSLKWHVHGPKVLDVLVEKASTTNAKYQEYREMVRKGGGTVRGFLDALQKKVGSLQGGK